jgi:hypothetical protein
LWGSHATTFLDGVRHDVGVEPTTVILRNVVIHEAYGKFNLIDKNKSHQIYSFVFSFHSIVFYAEYSPISIGNGDYGTQVFTDQSITEIIDFKQRYF